jgi:hypothetical protein
VCGDVQGFSLHALLAAQAAAGQLYPGAWNAALPTIAPLLGADLFGAAAEAKEVGAVAAQWKARPKLPRRPHQNLAMCLLTVLALQEARRCRSYESLELLAANVSFPECAGELLSPVVAHLPDAGQVKACHCDRPQPMRPGERVASAPLTCCHCSCCVVAIGAGTGGGGTGGCCTRLAMQRGDLARCAADIHSL